MKAGSQESLKIDKKPQQPKVGRASRLIFLVDIKCWIRYQIDGIVSLFSREFFFLAPVDFGWSCFPNDKMRSVELIRVLLIWWNVEYFTASVYIGETLTWVTQNLSSEFGKQKGHSRSKVWRPSIFQFYSNPAPSAAHATDRIVERDWKTFFKKIGNENYSTTAKSTTSLNNYSSATVAVFSIDIWI